jgi:hypothetical protein
MCKEEQVLDELRVSQRDFAVRTHWRPLHPHQDCGTQQKRRVSGLALETSLKQLANCARLAEEVSNGSVEGVDFEPPERICFFIIRDDLMKTFAPAVHIRSCSNSPSSGGYGVSGERSERSTFFSTLSINEYSMRGNGRCAEEAASKLRVAFFC